MGTSSSHMGNKDNKGLLPSDYNEQNPKPEVSWQTTKTGFSKYINGNGGGVGKTARNYVKASGGTAGLLRSSRSGIKFLKIKGKTVVAELWEAAILKGLRLGV